MRVLDYICWSGVRHNVTTVQYRSNASLEPRYRSNTDREQGAEWLGPSSRDITTCSLPGNYNKVDTRGPGEVTFYRIIQVI